MNHGRIITRHDGKTFHVGGRRIAPARGPRLALKNYLDVSRLPPAPDCDFTGTAHGLADVLANDRLGDCTCAGVGHLIDIVTGAAGNPAEITEAQVIALYEASCGYKPSDPSTDQGGDELTVLDYVCEKGIDGAGLHHFDASVLVSATDKAEVRAAMYLFGNLYFGVSLPDAWVNPFPSANGFTWDVGTPDPSNGHCFVGVGSNDRGIEIDTWGMIGVITYEAIAALAKSSAYGELHTVLTCDLINAASQKAPSGFAFDDLLADMRSIGAIAA